jgi:GT2 family glycosyltransferase
MDTETLSEATTPLVAIVVLNWNGVDDTIVCLNSLAALTYPNFSAVVVDNGSTDDSLPRLRRYTACYPLTLIETGRNLGFAGGNNVGIKRALKDGADYVLLLNNDTEVDPGMLDAFVAAADRFPDAGVFSGKIYFHSEPNRIWYAGAQWNPKNARFDLVGEGLLDDGATYSTTCETGYACGCAFFLPAGRLREIGLLDEDFFLYFEETDWCYRAREAGHPSIFVPDAKLWHKVSVSFGGEGSPLALYFITRNRLLWAKRHANLNQRLRVHAGVLGSLFRRFVFPLAGTRLDGPFTPKAWWWSVRSAYRDPRNVAFILGVRDYWLRRFGDCPDVVRQLAKKGRPRAADVATPVSVAGHK